MDVGKLHRIAQDGQLTDQSLPATRHPAGSDTRRMASLLVDCWEGAALRSRLRGNASPLTAMLDLFFQSAVGH